MLRRVFAVLSILSVMMLPLVGCTGNGGMEEDDAPAMETPAGEDEGMSNTTAN